MVKAIFSSPIGRKIATTAMLTTAVLGANATSLKTGNQNYATNQTEVVSKEAALAIKNSTTISSNPIQQQPETKELISNEEIHFINLLYLKKVYEISDRDFYTWGEGLEKLAETRKNLQKFYETYGTFGATVHLTRDACKQKALFIAKRFIKDLNVPENVINDFENWVNNVYTKNMTTTINNAVIDAVYAGKSAESYEFYRSALHEHFQDKRYFNDEEREIFSRPYGGCYKSRQFNDPIYDAAFDLFCKVRISSATAFANYIVEHKDFNLDKKETFPKIFNKFYDWINEYLNYYKENLPTIIERYTYDVEENINWWYD